MPAGPRHDYRHLSGAGGAPCSREDLWAIHLTVLSGGDPGCGIHVSPVACRQTEHPPGSPGTVPPQQDNTGPEVLAVLGGAPGPHHQGPPPGQGLPKSIIHDSKHVSAWSDSETEPGGPGRFGLVA